MKSHQVAGWLDFGHAQLEQIFGISFCIGFSFNLIAAEVCCDGPEASINRPSTQNPVLTTGGKLTSCPRQSYHPASLDPRILQFALSTCFNRRRPWTVSSKCF